jgi:hypothetical protein
MYTTSPGLAGFPGEEPTGVHPPPMVSYSELAAFVQPGATVYVICRYTDDLDLQAFARQLRYGVDPPVEAEELEAELADWRERIRLLLSTPEVRIKPSPTNMRVGFKTWFGFPTFNPPHPPRGEYVTLTIDRARTEARLTVRAPDGPNGEQHVTCTNAGIGANGAPDGRCEGRFLWSTRGPATATLTITYHVMFTSLWANGGQPVYLGPVPMTGSVEVDVKDLQARAS